MSKELESLERLAMPDDIHIKECKKAGIGLTEDYEVVEQALKRLEAIDNANPSEALKALERLKTSPSFMGGTSEYQACTKSETLLMQDYEAVKQFILKAQAQPSDEAISRDELCEAITRIFGSGEKFLDIIEEDLPYGYHYCKDDNAEIYIIDHMHNKYIHWYKLTHIGRDFHTDMKTKEEVIGFLQRLHDEWLKEKEQYV